jgi:PAS domain S-box-containing protein
MGDGRRDAERLRLLVESVRDCGIVLLDAQGRVETWNAGARRLHGFADEEIVGESFTCLHGDEDRATGRPAELLRMARRLGSLVDEGWRVHKDGSRFWAEVALTALYDKAHLLVGFALVIRDLTERRHAEEERLRAARAEEAMRLRDEFLSIASHELKTPLSTLQLQLDSVAGRLKSIDEKLAGRLDRAARSGERLAELVEMLLDVTRLSTGQIALDCRPFRLREAVEEVIERFREPAAQVRSSIALESDGDLDGCWDRLRVEQVVTNLLANALKYGAGAPVEVVLTPDGPEVILEVRDRGPGVPEARLPRIFERFERAERVPHYGGFGLGLYLTREIAEAHGGSVSAANRPDGGACFTVRLPRRLQPRDGDALH